MTSFDEVKEKIAQVKEKIDGYATALLSDIIKWRLNRVNAAARALSEFKDKVLGRWQLSYEQRDVFNRMAVVRKGDVAPSEVRRPRLVLSYNPDVGGYTELLTEQGRLLVPYVPKFVQVPYLIDKFIDDVINKGEEANIFVLWRDVSDITVSPDVIRDIRPEPLYLFKIPITEREYQVGMQYFDKTYKVVHEDKVISFDRMLVGNYVRFERYLSALNRTIIAGATVYRGQLLCSVDGATNVRLEGAMVFLYALQAQKETAFEVLGKQIGLKTTDYNNYYRELALVRMRGLWYLYEVD